jgi:hypothetical protein
MASYQDIETRLRVVEDKLDFVMEQLAMVQQPKIFGAPARRLTMKQLYQEERSRAAVAREPVSNVREHVDLADKAA